MSLALGNICSSSEEGTSLKYSKICIGAGADRTRRGRKREPGQTRKGWRTGKEIGFNLQVMGNHGGWGGGELLHLLCALRAQSADIGQ